MEYREFSGRLKEGDLFEMEDGRLALIRREPEPRKPLYEESPALIFTWAGAGGTDSKTFPSPDKLPENSVGMFAAELTKGSTGNAPHNMETALNEIIRAIEGQGNVALPVRMVIERGVLHYETGMDDPVKEQDTWGFEETTRHSRPVGIVVQTKDEAERMREAGISPEESLNRAIEQYNAYLSGEEYGTGYVGDDGTAEFSKERIVFGADVAKNGFSLDTGRYLGNFTDNEVARLQRERSREKEGTMELYLSGFTGNDNVTIDYITAHLADGRAVNLSWNDSNAYTEDGWHTVDLRGVEIDGRSAFGRIGELEDAVSFEIAARDKDTEQPDLTFRTESFVMEDGDRQARIPLTRIKTEGVEEPDVTLSEILSEFDFEAQVTAEGEISLTDRQGGNLGGIESERFTSAEEIIERLDTYVSDSFLDPEILLSDSEGVEGIADLTEAYRLCAKRGEMGTARLVYALMHPETIRVAFGEDRSMDPMRYYRLVSDEHAREYFDKHEPVGKFLAYDSWKDEFLAVTADGTGARMTTFQDRDEAVGYLMGTGESSENKIDEKKIPMTLFADTTDLFTQEEINDDNLADIDFPESVVRLYYETYKETIDETSAMELRIPESECGFNEFLETYTAEATEGLYDFAREHGYVPERVSGVSKGEGIERGTEISPQKTYQTITREQAQAILDSMDGRGKYGQRGRYIVPENDGYTAIDNSTGDAWTEHFDTLAQAVAFLDGMELDKARSITDDKDSGRMYAVLDRNGELSATADILPPDPSLNRKNPAVVLYDRDTNESLHYSEEFASDIAGPGMGGLQAAVQRMVANSPEMRKRGVEADKVVFMSDYTKESDRKILELAGELEGRETNKNEAGWTLDTFVRDGSVTLVADCEPLIVSDDHINACYELWIDVDDVFHTDTRDRDDATVEFYTDYYPKTDELKAYYIVRTDTGDEQKNYAMTDREKDSLRELMEAEAIRQGFDSLTDMHARETRLSGQDEKRERLTYDEIFKAAEGKTFGDSALRAKDEAIYQLEDAMRKAGFPYRDYGEMETAIDDYLALRAKEAGVIPVFDRGGNLLAWDSANPEQMQEREQAQNLNASTPKKQRLFVDMDGTLAVFNPVATLEDLMEPGYFRSLRPQMPVVEAVRDLVQNHSGDIEIYILSSVLTDNPTAQKEKEDWLKEYLPEIPVDHQIFPPCGEDKAAFVPGGLREDDLLLDDYTKNLTEWEPPAHGIKLLNGINHTKGSWANDRLRYDRGGEELAECILSIAQDGESIRDTARAFDEAHPHGTKDVTPENRGQAVNRPLAPVAFSMEDLLGTQDRTR